MLYVICGVATVCYRAPSTGEWVEPMRFVLKALGAAASVTLALPIAAASAAEPYGQWTMSTTGNTAPSAIGTEDITLYGQWRPAPGDVGDAVEFFDHQASAYGTAVGSESDNPGTQDFAMGVTFTSEPIPAGIGYSGNVMQKGLANKQGQVKISLFPTNGGTTYCRIKGTNGYKVLKSRVDVDNGSYHTAVCWREGGTIGLTVDGIATAAIFDPGSVATTQPLRIGNKSASGGLTDQHFGKNDCSVWVIGTGARDFALSATPC